MGRIGGEKAGKYNVVQHELATKTGNYAISFVETKKFTIIASSTVTFSASGATYRQVTVATGDTVGRPDANPTKAGYTFGGWCSDAAGSTLWDFHNDTVTQDTTLYAKWGAIPYSITYKNADDATHSNPSDYTINIPVVLKDAAKAGHVFTGWYADSITSPTRITEIPSGSTGDTTLWARWKKAYTIIFDSRGGTPAFYTDTVAEGVTVSLPANPTKSDSSFGGWYNDVGLTDIWTNGGVTGNDTIYARWNEKSNATQHTVIFIVNDGIYSQQWVQDSGIVTRPSDPTKAGYTFVHWYASTQNPGDEWNFNTKIAQNTTLYAKWNTVSYSITYKNAAGATNGNPTQYTVESRVVLTDAAKAGYKFAGWYADSIADQTRITEIPLGSTGADTLWARWQKTYTVTFSNNGSPIAAYEQQVPHGEKATAPAFDLEKPGYAFTHWYANNPSAAWNFGNSTITQDTTLYAQWSAMSYSITYKNTAGAANSNPTLYTVESHVVLTDAAKAGYKFAGWYADSIASQTRITEIPSGSTGDTTLWARWQKAYTVTFDSRGGTPTSYTYTVAAGDTSPTPDIPTKTNSTFDGWYHDAELTMPWSNGEVTADTTIYAKWVSNDGTWHTVSFSSDGSIISEYGQQVAHGEKATAPAFDLSKAGYAFAHWYANRQNSSAAWSFGQNPITQDTTLYARWSALPYSITYKNTADAANTNPTLYTVENADIHLAALARDGYRFMGWYADSAGSWDTVKLIPTGSLRDTTLWARWQKLHTVRFSSGDSLIAAYEQLVAHGDTATAPDFDLTMPGYEFAHWYADTQNPAIPWNFGQNTITQDTTLYARWTATQEQRDTIVINGVELEVTGDTIRYPIQCKEEEVRVYAPSLLSDTLRIDVATFERDTVIRLGELGEQEKTLKLERPFEFGSIVHAVLGNKLLIVVRNPENNAGFDFAEARWFIQNGNTRRLISSGKFYYASPSGEAIADTVFVELREVGSESWRVTCPYTPHTPTAEPQLAVYPNPVAGGVAVRLKETSFADGAPEEQYPTLYLIDVQGKVVYTGKTADLLGKGVTFAVPPGVYHLVLEGKAGKKLLKIAVGE